MRAIATPILSPAERIMDKAIYDAFNSNQYDDIFRAVSMGIDINFQRPLADGVTAFMAACAAGNMEMMERLRNLGAKANVYINIIIQKNICFSSISIFFNIIMLFCY